jgi:hypothetical protein
MGQVENYVDKGMVHKEFKVGKIVFLKVKAKRSLLKLGSFPNLAARYCGPFEGRVPRFLHFS